ncbi:MAG TPA: hypothetical protein VN437_00090, partial [Rectinemataceae bacterium]|nr:hypothetical protein [Rectinemataceae bacterium]
RISGLTLKTFLEEYLDIKIGMPFSDQSSLEDYIASLNRKILNNRVFSEKSSVGFEILGEEEPRPVRIVVTTFNSWSALAVPLLKYSSSDGISLALRYKDFNFLGTLETLSLSLDYYAQTGEAEAAAYFTVFLNAMKARWILAVAEDVLYVPDTGVVPDGTVSLSTSYRFTALGQNWYINPLLSHLYERDYLRQTLTGGFSTGFGFHAGLDWSFSAYTYLNDQYVTSHYPYMTNGLGISTSIPLVNLPYFGALTLSPSAGIFGTFGIEAGAYTDAGYSLGTGISFGRVDFVRNMRKGASASFSVSYANHLIAPLPTDAFDLTLSGQITAFTVFNPTIGFDFRLLGYWFGTWTYLGENPSFDWEDYIRGVKEARYGDIGAIANIEFPINFAQGQFFGVERLESEVFIIPFIDAGYIRRAPDAEFPTIDDAIFCAGMDFVIFPEYARAFTYRLSLGYDIMDYIAKKDFNLRGIEAWLGIGLHF